MDLFPCEGQSWVRPGVSASATVISGYTERGSGSSRMFLCFYFLCYTIRKEFGRTIFTIGLKQGVKETVRIPAFGEVTGREAMKTINHAEQHFLSSAAPPTGDKVCIEAGGIPNERCIQSI